jgi:phage tail sheath gpL-like
MGDIIIVGFPDSSKVPGAYGETKFGQSPIKFGSSAVKLLLCGLKHSSAGNLVVDTEVRRILSKEDADVAWGAGSEGALGAYAAFDVLAGKDGVEVYACAPTAAGGAAAGTVVATFTGTASANGTIVLSIGGVSFEVTIPSGTVQNSVAALVNTAAGTVARLPATSGVSTNAVTFTAKFASVRSNQINCYVDTTNAPGVTVVLSGTGGAALTSTATVLGRTFGNGSGTETLTNMHATLFGQRNHYVVPAQNDATSLAAWEGHIDSKAGPLENRIEHMVVGNNGNFAAATSIAQTTLNNQRAQLVWLEASEPIPFALACAMAAERAVNEVVQPNSGYDGRVLKGIRGQRMPGYWVKSYAAKQAALDVGVTPLESQPDGSVTVVRAITTRCLDGSTPDYRTLDTAESIVPDRVRERLALFWTSSFVVANPYVRPDPGPNEADPPSGVAYPSLWNREVFGILKDCEAERWITLTDSNQPSSEFNSVAKRIMTAAPVVPLPLQHQVGISVRQLNVP